MRTARAFLVAIVVITLVPLASGGPASARNRPRPAVTADGLRDLAALPPAMTCSDVAGLDLAHVTDAPVTVTSTTVVDDGTAPASCEVRGTIAPADTIVIRLPLEGWTQRYVQTGCGGLCGSAVINFTQASTCPVVEDGTVASATTDMGHQGLNDGSWAADNPQAQIDFAYRGVHATAEVAKAVITSFYGRAPAYSYFNGCSDGGREALMEAQRYPKDFDGISAGAPANNLAVQNTYHHAWNVLTNKEENGRYILLAAKLPMIHAAVLAACDGIDGLVDGLIDDPRRCDFDPGTLRCTSGQDPSSCLSQEEAGVVQRLHDGATDAKGRRLEPEIAHEWGSELEWTLFVPTAQGQIVGSERFVLSYLRYLVDPNNAHPELELSDLEFTVDGFWRTVQSSSYLAAMDPDLSAFARSGGRLLLWHGWNDEHISPQSTLAYYDALQRSLGRRTVENFTRLFLFPGMAHCGGGEGPNTLDVLTPTMAWVESGRTPGTIVASNVAPDGTVTRTRPVYAYPVVARYDGSGSIDDAANFFRYTPKRPTGPGYHWVGERLYSHGYQTSCKAVGTELVCRPSRTWLTRLA